MPSTPVTVTTLVTSSADVLTGWSFAETSGSVGASIEIHDAATRTNLLAIVNLAPGESPPPTFLLPQTVTVSSNSLYAFVTGSVKGAIWWA